MPGAAGCDTARLADRGATRVWWVVRLALQHGHLWAGRLVLRLGSTRIVAPVSH